MRTYASDHDGWLPGSPNTTGRYLWRISSSGEYAPAGYDASNVPPPAIELFDYIGPLCATMQIGVSPSDSGIERLHAYRKLSLFQCPANDFISKPDFGSADTEEGLMLSYCTATAFLLLPARIPTTLNTTFAGRVTMPTGGSDSDPSKFNFWSTHPSYTPRIDRVGPSSRKIFLADAGRRTRHSGAPQFIYDVNSDYATTLFSDFGPFYGVTRSYDRYIANNGAGSDITDGREFSYRHGAFRMNVVFFDGHTETLGDMESARPEFWLPTGSVIYRNTKLNAQDTVFWKDVWDAYLAGTTQSRPYIVP